MGDMNPAHRVGELAVIAAQHKAEVTTLRAENEALTAKVEELNLTCESHCIAIEDGIKELAQARADVERWKTKHEKLQQSICNDPEAQAWAVRLAKDIVDDSARASSEKKIVADCNEAYEKGGPLGG